MSIMKDFRKAQMDQPKFNIGDEVAVSYERNNVRYKFGEVIALQAKRYVANNRWCYKVAFRAESRYAEAWFTGDEINRKEGADYNQPITPKLYLGQELIRKHDGKIFNVDSIEMHPPRLIPEMPTIMYTCTSFDGKYCNNIGENNIEDEFNLEGDKPDIGGEMVIAQAVKTLYHLTNSSRLKDIKKNGLRIEYAGDWSDQPAIYLADSVQQAAGYIGREPEGTDVILAIDMSKLDVNYLVMDDDAISQLEEGGRKYNTKDWKKSLRISHQVAYLKNIPASAITVLYEGIDENWQVPE